MRIVYAILGSICLILTGAFSTLFIYMLQRFKMNPEVPEWRREHIIQQVVTIGPFILVSALLAFLFIRSFVLASHAARRANGPRNQNITGLE